MDTQTSMQLTLDEQAWAPPANPFCGVIDTLGAESDPDDRALWYPLLLGGVLFAALMLAGTWIWILAR